MMVRHAKLQRVRGARVRSWSGKRAAGTANAHGMPRPREHLVVALRDAETVVVAGASAMWVAYGSVGVFGTTVSSASSRSDTAAAAAVDLHALDWSGLLSIAPSRSSEDIAVAAAAAAAAAAATTAIARPPPPPLQKSSSSLPLRCPRPGSTSPCSTPSKRCTVKTAARPWRPSASFSNSPGPSPCAGQNLCRAGLAKLDSTAARTTRR